MHNRLLCLLAAPFLSVAATFAADPPPLLKIHTAIEVEFEGEVGQVYQLQGSPDFATWTDIGDPVFGVGRPVNRVFSTRSGSNVAFAFYRLQVENGPADDLAPWSLAGLTLNLDDHPGGDLIQFVSETSGVDLGIDPDPFEYQISRPAANVIVAELNYGALYYGVASSNKVDQLTLTFTAPGMGTWSRDEYRNGILKDHDVGVFAVTEGATPGHGGDTPLEIPAEIPQTLAGLSYLFQSGELPDRLDFLTDSTGLETGDDLNDDEPNVFSYTYELTGPETALLVVTFTPDRHDEYELTFANGAQGTFVRRELKNGVVDDLDRGSFSLAGTLPEGAGGGSGDPGSPPSDAQISGYTYVMQSGDIPETLVFPTTTAGVEYDDSAPTSFTYTHAFSSPGVASLVVQFDTDRWDEYDLTYTDSLAGTFIRREFRNQVLVDTDTGSFTRSRD